MLLIMYLIKSHSEITQSVCVFRASERTRHVRTYWLFTLSHSFLVILVHNADGLRVVPLFFSICRVVTIRKIYERRVSIMAK